MSKRLERLIKVAYNQILKERVSLKGRFVAIKDVLDKLREKEDLHAYKFTEKDFAETLLSLFYIKGKIDLVPGKGDYQIIDRGTGNKFSYMLWRNGEDTNKSNFKVSESIYPKANEVKVKQEGCNTYIYFIDERGDALEICLHNSETDRLMTALYKISAMHKLYSKGGS